MRKAHPLNLFALVMLAGCTVGPKYVPPEIVMPCEWHSNPSSDMVVSTLDDFVWWKSLNDCVLDSLIQRAASQNLDLHVAALRVLQSREERKGKSAALYPHIDGSIGYGHAYYNKSLVNDLLGTKRSCRSSGKKNVDFFEIGFDADWEIDLFGKTRHELAAAQAEIEASEENLNDVWIMLSAEIARNYVELRGFQQRLELLSRNIDYQKDTASLTQSLFNSGITGSGSLRLANEQLNALQAKKPLIELSIDKAIYRISILLGLAPGELYAELSAADTPLPCLPTDKPIVLPSELLRRRPDIRKAERELAASTEHIGSAVADLFPRFSLYGFIGDITTHLPSLFSHSASAWAAGPQLLFPLFNSRLIEQDIKLNKLRTEQALHEYQNIVLKALEESENALAALHYEQQRNHFLNAALQSAQAAHQTAYDLYKNGLKDYFEVLAADRSMLSDEEAAINSQVELLLDYIALYKAFGGGWDDSELLLFKTEK